MSWPIYFKDRLIVGDLDSNVGVATLWMPKESVAAQLARGYFSVCGQLYTKRGINPLLRNILANPKIAYIVLCGVDRQGSGDALLTFFNKGITGDAAGQGWRIIGDDEALLDKELPLDALELVRKNVEIFDLRMKPLEQVSAKITSLKKKRAFAQPQTFPESPMPKPTGYPSDMSVFKVRRDYIGDAWLDALKIIHRFGVETPGMYGKVKQVHNLCTVVEKENAREPKIADFMKFNRESLDKYVKGFFDKDRGSEHYTYGERIFAWDGVDQYAHMVRKLKGFPYDRGVLAILWKPHADNNPPANVVNAEGTSQKGWTVPCLVMILGQCIGDDFNMTAVFRNNDVYGAWPLNAFALRTMQQDICHEIGKNLGSLTTIAHIAEIYEIDWEDTAKVLAANDTLARFCQYDARSYYTVDVDGSDIIVKFFSPNGAQQLAEYKEDGKRPKVARDLCLMAVKDMLVSDLGAASDLGRQLAKAEAAVKLGLKFKQDNELAK